MMAPFILGVNRVLIITPSRLVRFQIAEDLRQLKTLVQINVVSDSIELPKVKEQDKRVTEDKEWTDLKDFDFIVSTPQCVSPAIEGVVAPPDGFFDLILIDEAHHSTANTWAAILDQFMGTWKILFTATPFRRDKKIIPGIIVYSYPLSKAFEDGDFGKIRFEPVNTVDAEDKHIAKKAEDILRVDRARGHNHVLMVRTSTKTKARELVKIYKEETALNLELIDSDQSYIEIKRTLSRLRRLKLDGIICVDMLGEGYDFPNLKIAAIHSPHKSLEVTLQFIGRFSRKASGVDEAKFIAIPNEIELEANRLYHEDAEWQSLITNLSENRIKDEIESRRIIENFSCEFISEGFLREVSLYALRPYFHIKVLRPRGEPNLYNPIDLTDFQLRVLRRDINDEKNCLVIICGEIQSPRWSNISQFESIKYYLIIIYYDAENNLLLVNSEVRSNEFYDKLGIQLTGSKPRLVPTSKINQVLLSLTNMEFFNVGVKNTTANNSDESYKIFSGSRAHKSIKKSDQMHYGRGHFFAKGTANGKSATIGLSSASKVWSNKSSTISGFLKWAKTMSDHVSSSKKVVTGTEIDYLFIPEELNHLPRNRTAIGIKLDENIYREHYRIYILDEETDVEFSVINFIIEQQNSDENKIRFRASYEHLEFTFEFSFDNDKYFTYVGETELLLMIGSNEQSVLSLEDFLNEYPLYFVFDDFSILHLHDYHKAPEGIPFDINSIQQVNWDAHNVDKTAEFRDPDKDKLTLHQYLNDIYIPDLDYNYVFYDHNKGEVADFICLKVKDNKLVWDFYHVKAMKSTKGNSTEDVYEVTSQIIRSVRFLNSDRILKHVEEREQIEYSVTWRRDTCDSLRALLKANLQKLPEFSLILVQPGIVKATISNNISNNLAAAQDYCKPYNCNLKILGS